MRFDTIIVVYVCIYTIGIGTIIITWVMGVITVEIVAEVVSNREITAIVNRITPSNIVIQVRTVVERSVVKVVVGVSMPRLPVIPTSVAMHNTKIRLPLISQKVDTFHIELFSIFNNDVHFQKPIINVTGSSNFNRF